MMDGFPPCNMHTCQHTQSHASRFGLHSLLPPRGAVWDLQYTVLVLNGEFYHVAERNIYCNSTLYVCMYILNIECTLSQNENLSRNKSHSTTYIACMEKGYEESREGGNVIHGLGHHP